MQAKQKGYSKVTLIVENQPTVVQGTQVLGGLVFKAAGVGFDLLTAGPKRPISSRNCRLPSQVGPRRWGSAVTPRSAVRSSRPTATLHVHLPKYVIATCLGPSIVNSKSLDKVLEGSLLAGAGTSNAADDARYAAIVDKYAPTVNPNPNVSAVDFAGALPVLSLAAIMRGAPAGQPVTAAGILARIETAKNVAIPLFGGATFTCDGTAIPLLKSVCSSTSAIGVLGSGYRVTHIQKYNPTALY